MTDLTLGLRGGLPDDIAYLRAGHPQADWRGHANFGEMANFWLHVHDSLRHHGRQLDQLTRDFQGGKWQADAYQRAFVPGINQFLSHLHGHHSIEDSAYFPKFRALDPRMQAGFDLLEADHQLIHQQLEASVDAARAMIQSMGPGGDPRPATDAYAAASARLLDLLVRHLADEEDLVIPAILQHGERSIL